MPHSSYSASERRGLIAIAIIALLLIGSGVTLSLCGRPKEKVEEIPVVVEHPELIDSTSSDMSRSKKSRKKTRDTNKTLKKDKNFYRQRSPLDEPVNNR